MVDRDSSDLRRKITLAASEAWKLNEALEIAIVHPPRVERTTASSRAVEAPIPWNDWAANLITELHASARRRELTLLELVTVNLAERVRGGSNGNTRRALQHLTRLVELATDDEALEVLRWLDHWCTGAKMALGLVEPIVPLSQDGVAPMRCPWCAYLTLRVRTATATAMCVNPRCHYSSDDRRRPEGRVETNLVTGVISIHWHGEIPESELETA